MSDFEKIKFPPQHQDVEFGIESKMDPKPIFKREGSIGSGKLKNKVALITGGDSGMGRAIAVNFAMEGADVCIVYYNENDDAKFTKEQVEKEGRKCLLISGDVSDEKFCISAVEKTMKEFGKLDILVNHAGIGFFNGNLEDITQEVLKKMFETNVFSMYYMVKAASKYLKKGASIINTASIDAYRGSPISMVYGATKSAIVAFTKSLSSNLLPKGIRVNAVAPGAVWTPFIPVNFPAKMMPGFGGDAPMGRAGEPVEIAACYVFLASEDASFMSGQVLNPNGGYIIN